MLYKVYENALTLIFLNTYLPVVSNPRIIILYASFVTHR